MDPTSIIARTRKSAINNIPNEIWAEILKVSSTTIDYEWMKGEGYRKRSSIILSMSQVCSKWRRVAVATSNLWTRIFSRVQGNNIYPHENLLALWLQRSTSQPLCVKLVLDDVNLSPQAESKTRCLMELLATIPRWRIGYVDISHHGSDTDPWYPLQTRLDVAAPILESLFFEISFKSAQDREITLPSKLWSASPFLTELAISLSGQVWTFLGENGHDPPLPYSCLTQSGIPYEQLTYFHLEISAISAPFVEAVTWAQIYTILSRAPNLEMCILEGIGSGSHSSSRTSGIGKPVILKNLKHLSLGNFFDSLPGDIDRVLTSPRLETLTIRSACQWDQASYARFIDRSSCHLNELYLMHVKMTPEDLLDCMKLSPTLKIIHLHSMDAMANEQVCHAMMEWSEASRSFTVLPCLQSLSSSRDGLSAEYVTDNFRAMSEMLKRRLCPPDGATRSFTTMAIPSNKQRPPSVGLQELCGYPWNLKVVSNSPIVYNYDRFRCRGLLY